MLRGGVKKAVLKKNHCGAVRIIKIFVLAAEVVHGHEVGLAEPAPELGDVGARPLPRPVGGEAAADDVLVFRSIETALVTNPAFHPSS